jgi:hypothetical protein
MPARLPRTISAAALAVACAGAVSNAWGEEEERFRRLPRPLADAPDDLSGHLIVSPRLAWLVPMGSADSGRGQRGATGAGPAAGFDLAYGLSRYVALHGRYDYGWFGRSDLCPASASCAARSNAFGVGVEYHLVNGAAFDPWMRAGVGFRSMTFERSQAGLGTDSASYAGFEWLHLALGGEWYPFRQVGFGPYMALDLGWYGKRPQNGSESSHHSFFSIGLRVAVDPAR